MNKIVALGALVLSVVLASCSSTDSASSQQNAGAGGQGPSSEAGQSSAVGGEAGGAGARSTSGGSAGEGEEAGQGGEAGGSASTFSVEGTVHAPKDGDIEGTVIIGCAWINDDCDDQKSQAVKVTKTGSSASYTITGLENGLTYLVIFWKDVNESGEVDDGDWVGVVADESGAARAFTNAAAGADGIMAVQQKAVATDVPEGLVGSWFAVAKGVGVTNEWAFAADGSASNAFTINSSVCGGGAGTAINSQGVISVDGEQLTFSPASGQKTVKPCSGNATTTDYYTNARHFAWRVGPSSSQEGTALYLTDLQDPDQTEAEFQKL